MCRVLIVDDEPRHRNGLASLIASSYSHYSVYQATDGQEAIEMHGKQTFDLIITDLKMPIVSGLPFIQKLREQQESVQIIILSAYANFEYAQKAISLGVYRYLTKPMDEDNLLDVLMTASRERVANLRRKPLEEDFTDSLPQDRLILECLDFVHSHFMKDITMESMANKFRFNSSYFSQWFKKQVGMNFSPYLQKTRIKHAECLLRTTKQKIYEIAKESGYGDPKYFIKVFKSEIGINPNDYRRLSDPIQETGMGSKL